MQQLTAIDRLCACSLPADQLSAVSVSAISSITVAVAQGFAVPNIAATLQGTSDLTFLGIAVSGGATILNSGCAAVCEDTCVKLGLQQTAYMLCSQPQGRYAVHLPACMKVLWYSLHMACAGLGRLSWSVSCRLWQSRAQAQGPCTSQAPLALSLLRSAGSAT